MPANSERNSGASTQGSLNSNRPSFLGADIFGAADPSHRGSWIISYADMMTIILTFFILLLSISTIAQTKYELLVQAFTGRKQGTLQEVKEKVDTVIKEQALGGQIETKLTADGLTLEFSNALLFDSGEATLRPEALGVLDKLDDPLVRDLDSSYGMVIEGYTDDVPINNERFESNWELSTKRAINVMNKLSLAGLDQRRVSVQGFAATRAATEVDIADPDALTRLDPARLDEVRAANRRVIIRIDKLDKDVLGRMIRSGDAENPAPNDKTRPEQGPDGKDGSKEKLRPFELPGSGELGEKAAPKKGDAAGPKVGAIKEKNK